MKKAKRMKKAKAGDTGPKSMDKISDLPKEILQRVLYFLSQEEAVRTSVLSKSWRHIWCTRPNLHFSEETFKGNIQYFLSVVDTALQRYSDQRLCLDEFHLSITPLGKEFFVPESISFLEKWIPLLTTMGVKEFRLSILAERVVRKVINLPSVVFEAESLNLLDLNNCNLGQKIPENIPFVRLQVLRLFLVFIRQEIFDKILSSCPLLTTLQLEFCQGLKTMKLENKIHKHLKHFVLVNVSAHATEKCSIEIDMPTLETMNIVSSKILFHGHKFSNLKSLTLRWVEISSNSIEQSELLCIDAPNIKYFDYSGFFIPSISFAPTCRLSNIGLFIVGDVDDAESWFLRLSKLLQDLRRSEIRLRIFHLYVDNMHVRQDILVQDIINGGNKPVVMDDLHLIFAHVPSLESFFNGLFCICRPRHIHPSLFSQGVRNKERELRELGKFFCKIQQMRENGNQEIWQELEHLRIEGVDKSLQNWEPLLVKNLSESALPDFDRFRVRLQWSDQDSGKKRYTRRTKHVSRTRGGY